MAAHRRIIFTRRNSSNCNRMLLLFLQLFLLLLCGGGGLVAPISGTTTAFLVVTSKTTPPRQHYHHVHRNHPTRRAAAAAVVVPFLYTHAHSGTTERRHSGCSIRHNRSHNSRGIPFFLAKSQSDSNNKNGVAAGTALKRVPPELEGIPIPFVAAASSSSSSATESSDGNTLRFIECYADCICTLDGEEYTIAVPCDYSVALCYYDGSGKQQLIPVEPADTATMDDLFPVAEAIVADQFGEELVLQRTPQTLTLVGELEDDDDEDEEEDDDEEDEDGEEEVEVLLSFEHRGKEFLLVRLLDPILLVGKKPTKAILKGNDNNDDDKEEVTMDMRVLLTPDEADRVMPQLEDLFLKFHNDGFYDDGDEEEDDDDYPDDITIVQAP